jgi:Na+-translocating ferredoxin:NAD+ oxidoreductase RnfC subunit
MRSLNLGLDGMEAPITSAMLCCNCGLCSFYGCPMELSPAQVNQAIRKEFAQAGFKNPHQQRELKPDREYENRKISQARLVRRLALAEYDLPAPLDPVKLDPKRVIISLKQHIGVAAVPMVREGEIVQSGQAIAQSPDGKLGARIHASISGIVRKIGEKGITIEREGA